MFFVHLIHNISVLHNKFVLIVE